MDGQELQQINNYLGCSISSNGGCERDISRRIGLARGITQMLDKVWSSGAISKSTKVRVYETLVLSVLLYNSETWTLTTAQENRLRMAEMACWRKIEGVTRKDRIRNEAIRS